MPPPQVRPAVVLYSRYGCHLCAEAERILRSLETRLGFTTVVVDIEADDDLLSRYMLEIPVVAVGEQIVARAPINVPALEDALAIALSSTN